MMRWPWTRTADPAGLDKAKEAVAQSYDNLALAEALHRAAAAQGDRWRAIERRNGLAEAIRADWRKGHPS